jgi:hypothetical protein
VTDERDDDGAAPRGEPAGDAPAPPSPIVTRRAALKVLGAVPIAGALGSELAWGQQATGAQSAPRQTHEGPNQPEHGQATPPRSTAKRAFFTAAEWRTVGILSDDIIPRDARSPSATEAGVPAYIDFHLSVPETSEETRNAVRGGLAWLDTQSRRRFGVAYASAKTAPRHQILDDIAWPEKAAPGFSHGVAFFSRFRDMVGAGFFSSPQGWRDLQYQGNVFNPDWRGCPDAAMRKLGVSQALMETRIKPE